MPRAVLEIDATTAGIVAAFGQIRTQAQETERVVRASMGNLFAGIPAGSRRAQQSVYRDTQTITRDQERAAQASVRAFVRAEEQKRRAAQLTAEGRARAERQASEIARTEAQRRGLTAEQEARVKTTALERVTRAVAAVEALGIPVEIGVFGSSFVAEPDKIGPALNALVSVAYDNGATHITIDTEVIA